MGCNRLMVLTLAEYERVRANPKRFIVLPGHELAELETVIETQAGYVVVQKLEARRRNRAGHGRVRLAQEVVGTHYPRS
jgi:hypothetical protein